MPVLLGPSFNFASPEMQLIKCIPGSCVEGWTLSAKLAAGRPAPPPASQASGTADDCPLIDLWSFSVVISQAGGFHFHGLPFLKRGEGGTWVKVQCDLREPSWCPNSGMIMLHSTQVTADKI